MPFARVYEEKFANMQAMSAVILAFLPGLILFSMLFVIQRVFYALGDTRTPFLLQCIQSGLFIVGALLCLLLPPAFIGTGLAAVTSIAGSAQAVVAIAVVRKRIGGMDGRLVLRRYVQYLVLSLAAGLVGVGVLALLGGFTDGGFALESRLSAILAIVVTGGVMAVVYLGLLTVLRNPELSAVNGTLTARFRRAR
jgi:putative peptidoglycan lipid II flippase